MIRVVGDTAGMLCLPAFRRTRAVFDPQGLHFLRRSKGPRAELVRRRVRAVVAASRRTICSSTAEREELIALAGAEFAERLVEVPNGIRVPAEPSAVERARAREGLGLDESTVAGLYLGQLEPRKQVLTAVRAAELAAERAPFVLLVAGEGPQAEAVTRHSGPVVRPLGFRRDPERLLAAADIFVMPSEREGLSLAVLEAMAHGLATVVSDGAGNPEAVGDAGVVVPVADANALSEALVDLSVDANERSRLGAAARERTLSQFGAERYLRDLQSVFEAALRS